MKTRRAIPSAIVSAVLAVSPLVLGETSNKPQDHPPQTAPQPAPFLPDLLLTDQGVWIWGPTPNPKVVAWGKTVTLAPSEAIDPKENLPGGACRFHVKFFMREANHKTTALFVNRIRSDSKVIAEIQQQIFPPALGNVIEWPKEVRLDPGNHVLGFSLDDNAQITETNEGNNKNRILYTLTGPCGTPAAGGPH